MKLLVNDKELANYLATLVDITRPVLEIPLNDFQTAEAIHYARLEIENGKLWKKKYKIKEKIKSAVERDTREYFVLAKTELEKQKKKTSLLIRKNINQIINRLGVDNVLENYKNSKVTGFVKSTGVTIDPTGVLQRREEFTNLHENCLLRNTVGNEQYLVNKIDNNLPFWFIDSGYTNFTETSKKWHRLVRNHLHYGKFFNAPVDRLGIFKTFPQQWRQGGDKILVIEPGQFAAAIFHCDIVQWRYSVEEELRKYTDKKIVFREKAPKKQRDPLYKHLINEDYYCVVNINSNAATEAIWAGVPVITLGYHISNPVSKNSLSDVNNLYRGPLADWLAMLSYSQFTYEELINGTAAAIVRKYHV
jgi:hypothetical protein